MLKYGSIAVSGGSRTSIRPEIALFLLFFFFESSGITALCYDVLGLSPG